MVALAIKNNGMRSTKLFIYIVSIVIFWSCASGDSLRYFSIKIPKSSSEQFISQVKDSLPNYGFLLYGVSKDSLISIKYIKSGALNEREVRLLLTAHPDQPYCRANIRITTFFRKDTIIEYYDEKQGFPSSHRTDFKEALLMIKRTAELYLPPKKRKN
jgi:hypothetical protein